MIILVHDVQSNEVISNTEFVANIIKCHIKKKLWTMHGHIQLQVHIFFQMSSSQQ